MRFTLFSLALAVAALAFVAVPDARAQYVSVYYGPGYSAYYGPTYYPSTYYDPGVYSYGAYVPPYSWSAGYYYSPRVRGWSYGSYYPYTNQYQYYYGYRTYPGRWRR